MCMHVRSFILSIHLSYTVLPLYHYMYIWMAINDVKLSSIVKSVMGDGVCVCACCERVREENANG